MEIKISKKPIKYEEAIEFLDERVHQVSQNRNEELIWFLEHKSVYTCGVNFNQKDVLDKNVKIVKTNRGGKITWQGRRAASAGAVGLAAEVEVKGRNLAP